MRGLLITADRFPPERSDVKTLWAQEMVARGYRLDWIMQSRAPLAAARREPFGSGVVLLGATDTGRRGWQRLRKHVRAIRNECRVFGCLRRGRYAFVLVRDKAIAALLARLAAWRAGVPCFFWLSFPFPENSLYRCREGVARYPWLYWLRGHVQFFLLYKLLLPRMDHVFVTSEQMKRDLIGYGIAADRITAFSMGVDAPKLDAALAQPVQPQRHTLVYLGEMARARGLDFLLRAFGQVLAAEPQARLLMVGGSEDPDDLRWLQEEAARLGIAAAVEFTGPLPQHEAWQRVRQARVALSPFRPSPVLDSASPTKLVEYLFLGVPTVVNEHPEQGAVIAACGAGRAVPWDEQAFAAAMLELLRLQDSSWQALARAGQDWVREHRSYDALAARLDAVLRNLVQEAACRQRTPS